MYIVWAGYMMGKFGRLGMIPWDGIALELELEQVFAIYE